MNPAQIDQLIALLEDSIRYDPFANALKTLADEDRCRLAAPGRSAGRTLLRPQFKMIGQWFSDRGVEQMTRQVTAVWSETKQRRGACTAFATKPTRRASLSISAASPSIRRRPRERPYSRRVPEGRISAGHRKRAALAPSDFPRSQKR
jgi:hypothetical protein